MPLSFGWTRAMLWFSFFVPVATTPKPSDRTCTWEQYQCDGAIARCIPQGWQCDGEDDCPNGDDEFRCSSELNGIFRVLVKKTYHDQITENSIGKFPWKFPLLLTSVEISAFHLLSAFSQCLCIEWEQCNDTDAHEKSGYQLWLLPAPVLYLCCKFKNGVRILYSMVTTMLYGWMKMINSHPPSERGYSPGLIPDTGQRLGGWYLP